MTIDWNKFRAQYAAMPYEEHRAWYQQIAEAHPTQRCYPLHAAQVFFMTRRPVKTVVELGGWDGALAADVGQDVERWTNYEIADVPQVCTRDGYERVIPSTWAWDNGPLVADAFVASHVLEHLSTEHLLKLIPQIHCRVALVVVPLGVQATDWIDYTGSHVLPLSMDEFISVWTALGWTVERRWDDETLFLGRRGEV